MSGNIQKSSGTSEYTTSNPWGKTHKWHASSCVLEHSFETCKVLYLTAYNFSFAELSKLELQNALKYVLPNC